MSSRKERITQVIAKIAVLFIVGFGVGAALGLLTYVKDWF